LRNPALNATPRAFAPIIGNTRRDFGGKSTFLDRLFNDLALLGLWTPLTLPLRPVEKDIGFHARQMSCDIQPENGGAGRILVEDTTRAGYERDALGAFRSL
jgi:hypothetical protein